MPPNVVFPRYAPVDTVPQSNLVSSFTVLRLSDQKHFLATLIPSTLTVDPPPLWKSSDVPQVTTRLSGALIPTAALPISRLLNHPNIISLVDIVQGNEIPGIHVNSNTKKYGEIDRPNDFTVWEDMNAGCLSYLLPRASDLPGLHNEKAWRKLSAPDFNRPSLPESLCWHVLRSVSRALLWLHHGVKETEGIDRKYVLHDDDWHPILIRDVSPGQIWFKHPTKGETYGECKLGGFQWAKVTGSPGGAVANAERVDDASDMKKLYWAPEIYNNTHLWTRASEIWSLGAVIYTMMTGIPPPRVHEYEWQISRMNDKGYSRPIRELVGEMLHPNRATRPDAFALVDRIEDNWGTWRISTKEGRDFVDIRDDLRPNSYLDATGK